MTDARVASLYCCLVAMTVAPTAEAYRADSQHRPRLIAQDNQAVNSNFSVSIWTAYMSAGKGSQRAKPGDALHFFLKALEESKKAGSNPGFVAKSTAELGVCYGMEGKYSQAEPYFEEALKLCSTYQTAGPDSERARAELQSDLLGKLGTIQMLGKRYTKAEQTFRKALAIDEGTGITTRKAADLKLLAQLYRAQGKDTDAEAMEAGSNALLTADLAKIDIQPYIADLTRRVKRAWFPVRADSQLRTTVQFKVHRGGEMSNLRLDVSSGLATADQAALKAIENSAPFRPLPAGAPDDVDFGATFEYTYNVGSGVSVRLLQSPPPRAQGNAQ